MSNTKSKPTGKVVDFSNAKIGFIGAGKITESLINGLINYGKVEPTRLHVAAPTTENLERLKQLYTGLHISKRNLDVFAKYACDIVFIAVHGSVIRNLYKQGGSRPFPLTTNFIPNLKKPLFVLSLVSGFDCKAIRECLLNPENPDKYSDRNFKIHRCLITDSCFYGLGIAAIDVNPDAQKMPVLVHQLLTSITSYLYYAPEASIDFFFAKVDAGMAFSYYFINAMADGAFKMGLSRQIAQKFAAKTFSSAAQTLLESGKHPNELKDDVCGPAGPAIYGIAVLDKADCHSGIETAIIETARQKCLELESLNK